jgi:thiol-disulfide isomerase/thioredoxin
MICKERYQKEGDVLVLDEHSFGFAIREFKYILVLFYDPECPHCQNFMPDYREMATELKKENFDACDAYVALLGWLNKKRYGELNFSSEIIAESNDGKGTREIDYVIRYWDKEEQRKTYVNKE